MPKLKYPSPMIYYTKPSVLKVKLDEGVTLPNRAYATDAGADICCREGFTIAGRSSAVIRTGVHVQLPPGTVGMIKSKSGLNIKRNIISDGTIDEGFTGEIIVKLYNLGDQAQHFKQGDKITQLVVLPVHYPDIVQVDEIEGGERGDAGYGSTGR